MVLAAALAAVAGVPLAHAATAAAQPTSGGREATLAEYRQHLVELNAVVESCAKARDTKSCDPGLVGDDDRVPLTNAPNGERRLVRYGWLRTLLGKAQLTDEVQVKTPAKPAVGSLSPPPEEPTRLPKPTTSQLLQAAEARLTQDIAQADGAIAATQPPAATDYSS